jgi:hypothetical protein
VANFQKTLKELEECCEALFDKLGDPKERIARRLVIRRCDDIWREINERRHPKNEDT